ncbi:MAG: hypothetical protein DRJ03_28835 [Chloroflexi bacterium]|nr:MAG: hypothetical protein DRJ03_28835 [Chloroflexota bacterium]
MDLKELMKIKKKIEDRYLRRGIGVSIGLPTNDRGEVEDYDPVIRFHVPDDIKEHSIPSSIEGIKTEIKNVKYFATVGSIPSKYRHRKPIRPIRPGISIGNWKYTTGTLSYFIEWNGSKYIMGNHHVFLTSLNKTKSHKIVQPGYSDDPNNLIFNYVAELHKFVTINTKRISILPLFSSCAIKGDNTVDVAIATPVVDLNPIICGEKEPIRGVKEPELGVSVRKSGRSTGVVPGIITDIDLSTWVHYGKQTVLMKKCFGISYNNKVITLPGDSGSPIYTPEMDAVGIAFASAESGTLCVGFGIKRVITKFFKGAKIL